jgi:hypothetical protein
MNKFLTRSMIAAVCAILIGSVPRAVQALPATGLTATVWNLSSSPLTTSPWSLPYNRSLWCKDITVSTIDADWLDGAILGCNSNNVVVKYSGSLMIPTTGTYTFNNLSDDGFRLHIDGVPIIQDWSIHSTVDSHGSGSIYLEAGYTYAIEAWYFEGTGDASAELRYSLNGAASQVLPSAWLGDAKPASVITVKSANTLFATVAGLRGATYVWYRCTQPGVTATRAPADCRSTSMTNQLFTITKRDRDAGYVRVWVRAGRVQYYSAAFDVRP